MIRIAILGYGNIGKAAEEAIKAAPDMELAGIYHHNEIDQIINHQSSIINHQSSIINHQSSIINHQ